VTTPPCAVVLLHSLCLNGSIIICIAFFFVAALAAPPFGSIVGWLQVLDARLGRPPRSPLRAVAELVVFHVCPLIAMLIDLPLRWPELRSAYRDGCCYRWLSGFWLVAGAQVLGLGYTSFVDRTGLYGGDLIDLYAVPRDTIEQGSVALAAAMGLTRADLEAHSHGLGLDAALVIGARVLGGVPAAILDLWLVHRWLSGAPASVGCADRAGAAVSKHLV